MSSTSHRTTSEKQAVKRAKARTGSRKNRHKALGYFIAHRWLPAKDRK